MADSCVSVKKTGSIVKNTEKHTDYWMHVRGLNLKGE